MNVEEEEEEEEEKYRTTTKRNRSKNTPVTKNIIFKPYRKYTIRSSQTGTENLNLYYWLLCTI